MELDEVDQKRIRDLADSMRAVGERLWVGGYIIGRDRAAGASPFNFGDDAVVGLATVIQTGAQLCLGTITLLEARNVYAAAALVRQIVEIEYLVWAFAQDPGEARNWLRSGPEERRSMWQPRHLRSRSKGRFSARDYSLHCEFGGHPSPDARCLLPHHRASDLMLWWMDLAIHTSAIWEHAHTAVSELDYAVLLGA